MTPQNKDNIKHNPNAEHLIDALLLHVYQEDSKNTHEQRIDKVLSAIKVNENNIDKKSESQVIRFPFGKKTWVSLAATMSFIMLTSFFIFIPNKSALAEVNALIQQLSIFGDRLYHITVTPSKHRPADTAPILYKPKSAAKWLNDAQLYMRSNNQFLLMSKTPKGYKYRGQNESASWRGNHDKLIEYKEQSKQKLPLANNLGQLAFLNVEQLLMTLKQGYNLTLTDHITLDDSPIATSPPYSQITAVRKSSEIKGVKKITIVYRTDIYQIHQIIFNRIHLQGKSSIFDVQLSLQNTDTLPPDFFEPGYHLTKLH